MDADADARGAQGAGKATLCVIFLLFQTGGSIHFTYFYKVLWSACWKHTGRVKQIFNYGQYGF
jgi:hypothetical protein